jgi:rubrerythrin
MIETEHSLKDLILTAIKSEIDSNMLYSTLANRIQNGLMKDKFHFLAAEETKHKEYLEAIFKKNYPKESLVIPKVSIVPLPEITVPIDEDIPLSTILAQAMNAEQAAHDFYAMLSKKFKDIETSQMLQYFADMELGHYRILQTEKESIERFEQADVYWEMVHAGP